uniref:Uncharacterized protein n=1 Tax=Clastoptera arizonana TaxID=38151 RepID=A0A1B6C3R4_9HEMI
METNIESCTECCAEEIGAPGGKDKVFNILDDLNNMYTEQLKKAKDSSDGTLQLQIETLQHWVFDLSEQNKILVKTIEELELEALKKNDSNDFHVCEARSTKSNFEQLPEQTSADMSKYLEHELKETKKQLDLKSNLEKKYLKEIEELKKNIEDVKKSESSHNQVTVHRSSMTEFSDSEISGFNYELEATKAKLTESENELSQLRSKLSKAESNIQSIRSDLNTTEKNARDMRAALTAEVAEKHDQILALKREVLHLEDQLRKADMQTHFKDDIIKKLREDVKVARSKETLAEVLGITEKAQMSKVKIDQLKQQLENKEQLIACLEEKLKRVYSLGKDDLVKKHQERDRRLQTTEAALCRIRQQVEWFTNNILQQMSKTNINRQFENHLKTQLSELYECFKYPDFDSEEEPLTPDSPITSAADMFACKLTSKIVTILPPKETAFSTISQKSESRKLKSEVREQAIEIARLEDTLDQTTEQLQNLHEISYRNCYIQSPTSATQHLIDLQKEVDKVQAKIRQSWEKLNELSQKTNTNGLKSELDHYITCTTKEQTSLARLQSEVKTLLAKLTTKELDTNHMTQLIESLRTHLIVVQDQLQKGLNSNGQNLHYWIKPLQESLTASQNQLQEIENSAKLIKEERETLDRTKKVEETLVRHLQGELYSAQQERLNAFDKLCLAETLQRQQWNHLISCFINHHDLCKREQVASDDMKQEMNQLVISLSAKAKQFQSQEKMIRHLKQSLLNAKNQSEHFYKRRSFPLDTDGDDEESCHMLAKTQQEVDTLRHMVNMRDRQILEKEQKISALKKALSKTRSDFRVGRYPNRVSIAPSVGKVGEFEQIQAIVSRIQLEVGSVFDEMENRDQQFHNIVEELQNTIESTQVELGENEPHVNEIKEEKLVKMKSAMKKCQNSIKQFVKKIKDFITHRDTIEENRALLQSRMSNLQSELEAAQEDLFNQFQAATQEEPFKNLINTTAEIKAENLKSELERNKKMMFEVESRSRSAEEQNIKLKQDLAMAQEELSRVRSMPSWKKTVTCTSEMFKSSTLQNPVSEINQNLIHKENSLAQVQEDLRELSCNLQSRDKLIETQQETIKVLQSSLKIEQEESDELRHKITKLESQKNCAKIEYQQKVEELESTVNSLQEKKKKSEEASKKHQRSVSAMQIVIYNLKEKINAENGKVNAMKKEIKQLLGEASKQKEILEKYEQKLQNLQSEMNQRDEDIQILNNQVHRQNLNDTEVKKKLEDSVKEIKNLNEEIKNLKKQHKMDMLNSRNDCMMELHGKIQTINDELNAQIERNLEYEKELRKVQDKLVQATKKEANIHKDYTKKEAEWMKLIRENQTEISKLTDMINSLNDESSKIKLELEHQIAEHKTTKQKLEETKGTVQALTKQLNEKESVTTRLQGAVTHLSQKVINNVQNLEDKDSLLIQYEEKIEELQLSLKENEKKIEETVSLKKEISDLQFELNIFKKNKNQIARKDSMIEILEGKLEQLTIELESCQYLKTRDDECVAALLSEVRTTK